MGVDYFKEEVLRMLTGPMDKISCLFQAAFDQRGFPTWQVSGDWAKGTIVLEFMGKNPTSDGIRDTIFSVYEKEWGGKPGGLEIAYNRALEYRGRNDWVYSDRFQHTCIRLFITSSPQVLADLITIEAGDKRVCVLDHKEYTDWKLTRVHRAHQSSRTKPKLTIPQLVGIEDFDPGEPIPMVKIGLFSV